MYLLSVYCECVFLTDFYCRHAEMVAIDNLILTPGLDNVDTSILRSCDLYVTCEPCIMCASALAKVGIHKVIFGCFNDRFGGNGSILSIHAINQTNEIEHQNQIHQQHSGNISLNIDMNSTIDKYTCPYHNYPIESGLMKNEAIDLFQQFYTRENRRAPIEKRKRKPIGNSDEVDS